jgi:hypothetical protein
VLQTVDKKQSATLPASYTNAKAALVECQNVDECKEWADKAAALASYAKQAEDTELEQMAACIRARAMRRAGELLKQFDGRGGDQRAESKTDATGHSAPTQSQAATEAGFSERQAKNAVRIANIPEQEFERQVESKTPPTITTLAEQGTQKRVKPDDYLRGRDPVAYNKALHLVGEIVDHGDVLKQANIELAISGMDATQKGQVKASAEFILQFYQKLLERIAS